MERLTYHVSDRPESYELWGEVSRAEARTIAEIIVMHAAKRFPRVDLVISGAWNVHDERTKLVTAYIEKHWRDWVAKRLVRAA
jgi:hypothetical protein